MHAFESGDLILSCLLAYLFFELLASVFDFEIQLAVKVGEIHLYLFVCLFEHPQKKIACPRVLLDRSDQKSNSDCPSK